MLTNEGGAEWLLKALLSLFSSFFCSLIYSAVTPCIHIPFFMSSTTSTTLINFKLGITQVSQSEEFQWQAQGLSFTVLEMHIFSQDLYFILSKSFWSLKQSGGLQFCLSLILCAPCLLFLWVYISSLVVCISYLQCYSVYFRKVSVMT